MSKWRAIAKKVLAAIQDLGSTPSTSTPADTSGHKPVVKPWLARVHGPTIVSAGGGGVQDLIGLIEGTGDIRQATHREALTSVQRKTINAKKSNLLVMRGRPAFVAPAMGAGMALAA